MSCSRVAPKSERSRCSTRSARRAARPRSKRANVLFTRELAKRLGSKSKVRSYALHPGVVASDAWRRVPWPIRPLMKLGMVSNEEGAQTSLYCATSPEVADHDGRYYDKSR